MKMTQGKQRTVEFQAENPFQLQKDQLVNIEPKRGKRKVKREQLDRDEAMQREQEIQALLAQPDQ